MKQIYIVLSQTGTIMSKCMKIITGANYNHISLSLDNSLTKMYSFSRLNPKFPFPAGFMEEGRDIGTFARFTDTEICVLALDVEDYQYGYIVNRINNFIKHANKYKYNYWGIFFAVFGMEKFRPNHYYCSQFVKKMLVEAGVVDADKWQKALKPIDFYYRFKNQMIYQGYLKDYQV